jgi:hypothetical protein
MTAADRLDLAVEARANVARVITLLQSPTASALDQSSVELTAAIVRMEQLQREIAGKGIACAAKPLIAALRKDLQRAGLLLRHAWELRIGRGGQLGYSRTGELVPQQTQQVRWVIEG